MSRLSLRILLREGSEDAKRECMDRWLAKPGAERPSGKPVLSHVSTAMEDEKVVLQRIGMLPRKLQDLLEVFFQDDGAVRVVHDLFTEFGRNFKSRFDLDWSFEADFLRHFAGRPFITDLRDGDNSPSNIDIQCSRSIVSLGNCKVLSAHGVLICESHTAIPSDLLRPKECVPDGGWLR